MTRSGLLFETGAYMQQGDKQPVTTSPPCSPQSQDDETGMIAHVQLKLTLPIGLSHARPNSGISGDLLSENEAKPAVI